MHAMRLQSCALLALACLLSVAVVCDAAEWGTYRPNVYFGARAKTPDSPMFGIMWYDADDMSFLDNIRHDCSEGDHMRSYGWLEHNGDTYGKQNFLDTKLGLNLTVQFVQDPASRAGWSARITGAEYERTTEGEQGKSLAGLGPNHLGFIFYVVTSQGYVASFDYEEVGEDDAEKKTKKRNVLAGHDLDLLVSPAVAPSCSELEDGAVGAFKLSIRAGNENEFARFNPRVFVDPTDPAADRTHDVLLNKTYFASGLEPGNYWDTKTMVRNILGPRLQEQAKRQLERHKKRKRIHKAKQIKEGTTLTPYPPVSFKPMLPTLPNAHGPNGNVHVFQQFVKVPFTTDVSLTPTVDQRLPSACSSANKEEASALSGLDDSVHVSSLLEAASVAFNEKFHSTFSLSALGFDDAQYAFAKAAFSNCIGGLGYFYGDSVVQEHADSDPYMAAPQELFTAVPSRSFFPRGFMWDEGFHQMLISAWDPSITYQVLDSWFALIDENGWLPREQILGAEARSRVPQKFQIQWPDIANPPTFFLTLRALRRKAMLADARVPEGEEQVEGEVVMGGADVLETGAEGTTTTALGPAMQQYVRFVARIFPALTRHVQWFFRTQAAKELGQPDLGTFDWLLGKTPPEPITFRWAGRTEDHCLASGLDDYPRASWITDLEGHVDLHSWMILLSQLTAEMAEVLDTPAARDAIRNGPQGDVLLAQLGSGHLVPQMSLGELSGFYKDKARALQGVLHERYWNDGHGSYCDYAYQNETRKAVCHTGYISLFPFLTCVLPGSAKELKSVLHTLQDPDGIWSPYGLRSLSKSDPLYHSKEDYWRGNIWINLNYMAVQALDYYARDSTAPNDVRAEAKILYKQLRTNLVDTIYNNYKTKGYLFEQYQSDTGVGRKSHPFTGWTALVTLMMGEIYD